LSTVHDDGLVGSDATPFIADDVTGDTLLLAATTRCQHTHNTLLTRRTINVSSVNAWQLFLLSIIYAIDENFCKAELLFFIEILPQYITMADSATKRSL